MNVIVYTDANMQDSHLQVGHAVEIIGRMQSDLSVRVLMATDVGTNIGMFPGYLQNIHLSCVKDDTSFNGVHDMILCGFPSAV